MNINDPEVIAELEDLYPEYETALVSNEVDRLVEMFWASPRAVRFGATENLFGIDEIRAFRKGRPAVNLARQVRELRITSFGKDFASINLEFERVVEGRLVNGRQSQTWVRFPQGWRIVSAHVSALP
jgi:hypothetical protein